MPSWWMATTYERIGSIKAMPAGAAPSVTTWSHLSDAEVEDILRERVDILRAAHQTAWMHRDGQAATITQSLNRALKDFSQFILDGARPES